MKLGPITTVPSKIEYPECTFITNIMISSTTRGDLLGFDRKDSTEKWDRL
jgi:hypothetical protein